MRIVGGDFKGFSLGYPKQRQFRPTQDRVREAIASIFQDSIPGARFLDLCCGTGSMGIEFLSRGAKSGVFVDLETSFVTQNLAKLDQSFVLNRHDEDSSLVSVYKRSVLSFITSRTGSFDLIFLDPPWDQESLYFDALKRIFEFGILSDQGHLICEHSRHIDVGSFGYGKLSRSYKYGRTIISVINQ